MNPVGGDEFATLQIEAGPGLGHAAKGHFLDGLAGGRIHDGGDDTHRQADTDGRACMSMVAVDQTVFGMVKSRRPLCANSSRSVFRMPFPEPAV